MSSLIFSGPWGAAKPSTVALCCENPNIEFYYLQTRETEPTLRPANAHPIPYQVIPGFDERANEDGNLEPPAWALEPFRHAGNVARSVANRTFDVVDTPDYRHVGVFLAPAFRQYHVRHGRLALSMHGRMSNSIRTNWGTEGQLDPRIVWLEESQYAAVDTRYFISESYRDEWARVSGLQSQFVDPMWFFSFPRSRYQPLSDEAPSINFVGRTEKCKGAHLFINILWWLSRTSYSTARIIGPDSFDAAGVPSTTYLRAIAAPRVKDLQFLPSMTPQDLASLFGSRAVTLVPSQLDTLNLVALESLLSGCPTVIGSGAGVCSYLRSASQIFRLRKWM